MNGKPGRYIVIEGIDGAGKTTQANRLRQQLEQRGKEVEQTHEPGGTPIGEAIRSILKNADLARTNQSDFELFTIARRELAAQAIGPWLLAGKAVISDRNWFSSYVYQGCAEPGGTAEERFKAKQRIMRHSREALGALFRPEAVILDLPVGLMRRRLASRRGTDYFELKGNDYFERVREGYLELAQSLVLPVVDASQSADAVQADVVLALRLD